MGSTPVRSHPPQVAGEQNQYGVNFQPADEHGKGEHELYPVGEDVEIPGGPDEGHAGADIGKTGQRRGEIGRYVIAVKGDDQREQQQKKDILHKVHRHGLYRPVADPAPVYPHKAHALGIGGLLYLDLSGFGQNGHAGDLKPAAGAARAGADQHQQHQYPLAVFRPNRVIHRAEAGCAYNRGDVKIAVPQSRAKAVVELAYTQRDGQHRRGDNAEIPPQLLVFDNIPAAPDKQQEIEVEVHAEKDHERGGDHLNIEAAEGRDAGAPCGKAACAGGGEGVEQRVIKAHAAAEEHNGFHRGESYVNKI